MGRASEDRNTFSLALQIPAADYFVKLTDILLSDNYLGRSVAAVSLSFQPASLTKLHFLVSGSSWACFMMACSISTVVCS